MHGSSCSFSVSFGSSLSSFVIFVRADLCPIFPLGSTDPPSVQDPQLPTYPFHPPGQGSSLFPSPLPEQSKTIRTSHHPRLVPSWKKRTSLHLCPVPKRMSKNQLRNCPKLRKNDLLPLAAPCSILARSLLPSQEKIFEELKELEEQKTRKELARSLLPSHFTNLSLRCTRSNAFLVFCSSSSFNSSKIFS